VNLSESSTPVAVHARAGGAPQPDARVTDRFAARRRRGDERRGGIAFGGCRRWGHRSSRRRCG